MNAQIIEANIQKKVLAWVNQSVIEKIAKQGQSFIHKTIIERVMNGLDLFGDKFGGYNASYKKKKAYQYATKKYGTYKFASTSAPLRLTGRLLSSIQVKIQEARTTGNVIKIKYLVTVPPELQPQVEGLQSTVGVARNQRRYSKKAWYFLGISTQLGEDNKLKNLLIAPIKSMIRQAKIRTTNV
jgi:hypothetical protein